MGGTGGGGVVCEMVALEVVGSVTGELRGRGRFV